MSPLTLLDTNPIEYAQAMLVVAMGVFLVYVAARNLFDPYPFGRPAGLLLLLSGILAIMWQVPIILPFDLIEVATAGAAGVLFFVTIPLSVLLFVLTSFSTRLRERKTTLETVERQRADLAVTEAHLRSVLEHAPDQIATIDRTGNILSLNNLPGGLGTAAVLGRPVYRFFEEGSGADFRAALHRVFTTGSTESLEVRTVPYLDHETWYSIRIAPLLAPKGADEAIVIGTDVTGRRAMEMELREERERYATLSDAAFEGILLHKDDVIIDANQACATILGYDREGLVGLRIPALVPAEDIAVMRERILSPVEGHYPGRLVRKDGRVVQVEVHRRLITLGQEPVQVSVIRDVSHEFEARRKDRTLRALFGHADDAIFILDLRDGRVLDCNPAAAESLGTTRESLLWREMSSFARTAAGPLEWRLTRHALVTHGSIFTEGEHVRSDGTVFPIEVAINPIGEDPELGPLLVAVARDITARKRAQEQIVTTASKLRTVIEATNDGLLEWDLLSDRILWTKRLPGMEEPGEDAPFGPSRALLRLVHPEDRAALNTGLAICRDGRPHKAEFRVRRMPSGWLWARCSMTPIQDQDGRVVRIVGAMQDITSEKREQRLREAMERLREEAIRSQESNRLKSEFLANMSHELRTPLNVIIGFADLLASGKMGAPASGHGEFIADIRKSGHHLLQIINDVLDLAKIEAGRLQFTPEETRLDALLEDVRETLKPLSDRRALQIDVAIRPGLDVVLVDPTRLRQVVYNYVTNAIKFSREGGVIQIRARPVPEGRFELIVEDHGIGIAEADLARLFHPFEQLDAGMDKQYQGTGLGLALTKRIVEEMGGTVGVESTVGAGSRFYALLPVRPRAPSETPATPTQGAVTGPYVLMVSDAESGAGAARLLVADGYRVTLVADPIEALQRAAQAAPAVLVLDIDVINIVSGDTVWHAMESAGEVALVQWTERASSGGRLGDGATVVSKRDGPEALRDAIRRLLHMDGDTSDDTNGHDRPPVGPAKASAPPATGADVDRPPTDLDAAMLAPDPGTPEDGGQVPP